MKTQETEVEFWTLFSGILIFTNLSLVSFVVGLYLILNFSIPIKAIWGIEFIIISIGTIISFAACVRSQNKEKKII